MTVRYSITDIFSILLSNHLRSNSRIIYSNQAKSMSGISVAVCQMTSSPDKYKNLKTFSKFLTRACEDGAKVIFFPEGCDFIDPSKSEVLKKAESLDEDSSWWVKEVFRMARFYNVFISLGIHEKGDEGKVYNSQLLIDQSGHLVGCYRKTHLFDRYADLSSGKNESSYINPGNQITPPVMSPIGPIGMEICYDVRFPELSRILVNQGAAVLTFPSAFSLETGPDHWEVLLRARAIENQCYVVASAQVGEHYPGRTSYGHSMVIDPWGRKLLECDGNNEEMAIVNVDPSSVFTLRTSMPVLKHKREDLYSKAALTVKKFEDIQLSFSFGKSEVKKDQVFFCTAYSFAFVNRKCVVPGHVLIAPIRCVKRVNEMRPVELNDIMLVAQRVESVLANVHGASSTSIVIQDGPEAGQTVQHVHIHILPRKKDDFLNNDDIYLELQKHDKDEIEFRDENDMAQEATYLS